MEDGCLKSKRLSYTAKFKREVVWWAEKKGNRKATAVFGVYEGNIQQRWTLRQRSASVRHHERNSVDPRKDNVLNLMMQSSCIFK
jgi:hypothetical protein